MIRRILGLLVVCSILSLSSVAYAASTSKWYVDVQSSMALYPEIRGLWLRNVADAFNCTTGPNFYPTRGATREEFFALLAKAFGLSPIGGSPYFPDYNQSNASSNCAWGSYYPYVQAAAYAGIVRGDASGRFNPKQTMTRVEAIVGLIRALELEPYAMSLSQSEINAALSRFSDGYTVPSSFRPHAAAAIILGIWKGSGNQLMPNSTLERQHAAAFLFRSASMRIRLSSSVLYQGSTVSITGEQMMYANVVSWSIWVESSSGTRVREWSGSYLPTWLSWDGRNQYGQYVQSGLYYVKGYMIDYYDGNYRYIEAAPKPLTVIINSNRNPIADFYWTPSNPTVGQIVSFQNSSYDPDGDPLSYDWEYRRPGSSTWVRFSTSRNPTLLMDTAGTWTIRLTVWDNRGGYSVVTKSITVTQPNLSPVADFSWSPQNPLVGQTVYFTNYSYDPDGDPLTYRWEYRRPGSSTWVQFSTSRNPSLVVDAEGAWLIRLTVQDNRGGTGIYTVTINVLNSWVTCDPVPNPIHAQRGVTVAIYCYERTLNASVTSIQAIFPNRTVNLQKIDTSLWRGYYLADLPAGNYSVTFRVFGRAQSGPTLQSDVNASLVVREPAPIVPPNGMDVIGPILGVPGKVRLVK